MYLKRLEVFGFKTFAERVELEFAPGVTAIVGPNGAGKSNLADAILWVFGEQSLKALRSSRSQDIIFSGSRDKKAVGLAEVSLTLDNSSGRLGLDFPEVTVTRRVYRSGEGEYLINRIPCRLKDIHDLFLDTGIGRQAYSIINQSQVDAILSIRPEDRRELLEEAAGVGKYRNRKRETLRKLENTRANLVRVNDIIGELESQLEPLARQSEQAREYSQISRELSLLRLSLLVADHDAFSASFERAKEKEAELEAEVESCRTRETQFAAEEVGLRAQLTRVEGEQEELRTLAGRLGKELDRQEGQQALAAEKIAASERQTASLENDCRQFEASQREAELQQEQSEARRGEIRAKEEAVLADLKARQAGLAKAAEEIARREKALAAARSEQLDLLGSVSEKKNFFGQGASLLRAAENRRARLAEEIAGANQELESRLAGEREKSREIEQLSGSLPQLRARLEELLDAGRQAGERLQQSQQAETEAAKEVLAVRSRLEALQQLAVGHEGFSESARALAEQGFSLVSDLLRAPARLAPAVEVALGPWLEALVCENEAEALRGRQWLRENRGQARFLLREELAGADTAGAYSAGEGILGRAVELVKFDEQHRPLFARLLGRVLIAESLEAALRLRRQLAGEGWQVVTLEGELLFPAGLSLGKAKDTHGPLSRQAEIEQLQQQLGELEAAAQRAQQALAQARRELAVVEEEAAAAREQLTAGESRLASLLEALALLRSEIERSRQRLETFEAECRGLQEEIGQSRGEQAALEQELLQLEAQQQTVDGGLAEAEAGLRELRSRRDELAAQLEQVRIMQASLAGEQQAQEAKLQSLAETQRSLTGQIQSRRESLHRLTEEKRALEEDLTNIAGRLEELRQAWQKAQGELEAVAAERQRLLEAIAAQLEEARENRDRREGLQASLHRLQLRITQVEGELGFLRRNLEEDHRISLDKARELAQPVDSRREAQEKVAALQSGIEALGTVNLGAMEEYERVKSRLEFLTGQREDLEKAREDLERIIAEIDATAREKFLECFQAVQKEFDVLFKRLFNGGETELRLVGEGEVLDSGIEVDVTVPGKRRQNLLLLSGGERALTAMALIFALLKVKPTPFVVLDEIDAPLDDSNIGRYAEVLRDFAQQSQFITITHNKGTMEAADTLYGVTMEKAGVSTLIGMRLSELPAA